MYFEDLEIGHKIQLAPVTILKEDMLAFARKYDPIPLHTDETYAKQTKFGTVIAPGVMSFMSVWAQYLAQDFVGDELVAGKSTKIEWLAPVYADDVLTGEAYISKLTERNPYNGIAEITIDVYNQHHCMVLTDVTESIVKRKVTPKH